MGRFLNQALDYWDVNIGKGKLNTDEIRRGPARYAYFIRALMHDRAAYDRVMARHKAWFDRIEPDTIPQDVWTRVNYLNKLADPWSGTPESTVSDVQKTKIVYFIDLMEHAKGFGPDLGLNYRFGDVTEIPPVPAILKSRPIHGENAHSVVMKLEKFRHFNFRRDPVPFRDKIPTAIWRGGADRSNMTRRMLAQTYSQDPDLDVGHVGAPLAGIEAKGFKSIRAQRGYRYIISLEGHDVATNLKWIMTSNSLAFVPPLKYETWFMEGRLKAGEHFVGLEPDCSDLKDKVTFYNDHPEAAEKIIANAHAWVRQFQDNKTERLISCLVLQKYFEQIGQLPTSRFSPYFESNASA